MIRAIFFDAGGVLITVDGFETASLARKLGLNPKKFLQLLEKYHDPCESGKISDDFFLGKISEAFAVGKKQLKEKWLKIYCQSARRREPVYKIAFALKKCGCKIGIISNTKKMYTPFNNKRKVYAGFRPIILSYKVGVVKPHKKIYSLACKRAKVKPAEAVFIDDRIINVKGARAFGMKAIHYRNVRQLKRQLKELGLE